MSDFERLAADEYEKQYYGFSSTELCEDFEEKVQYTIKEALIEIDKAFKEQNFDTDSREQQIDEICTMFLEKTKVPLAKFKDEARKIFAIPKNVILDEDKYNTNQLSDQDLDQLKNEVTELEKELLQEKVFLAKCKQQKEIIDAIKPLYRKVDGTIKFLKTLSPNTETQFRKENVCDIYRQHIQCYFTREGAEVTDPKILEMKLSFPKKTEDFFNSHK